MEEVMTLRKSKYLQWGLTLQPTMFIVQGCDSSPALFYTTFDGISYQLPSLLRCLDACFKVTQVLNLKYNIECNNLWLFIQRKIYNIKTVYDKMTSSVVVLENALSNSMISKQ